MTAPVTAQPDPLDSPADLQRLMRTDSEFSDQQWEAISAPLEPAVVIAGAGSGKTSVMAARVVYLVATGQVAPDQVLGLTFTTKATAELAARVRAALWPRPASTCRVERAASRTTSCPSGWSPWSPPTTPTPPRCSPSTGCASATSRTPG